MPDNDEALDRTLHGWKVNAALPPRFQEQVWQKIARREQQPRWEPWTGLLRLVEVVLPRPRVAFAYLAALLIMGVAAGSWAAQIKNARLDAFLSSRYVHSVDPSQHTSNP